MKKKTNIDNIINSLILYIDGKDWFQAEAASEVLNIPINDIRTAIHNLRIRKGWSISERNSTPSDRKWDWQWCRTCYNILKRPTNG